MTRKEKRKKTISGMVMLCVFSIICVLCTGGAAFGSGWISVVSEAEGFHEYKAYLLIGGHVAEDGVISEVFFGEGITPALWKDLEVPFSPVTATRCAEWIAENVEKDDTGGFAVAVAIAAAKHRLPVKAEFSSGENIKLDDGYYLIISDDSQPVMALAGNDSIVTINEKSTAPKISKGVREGKEKAFGEHDDAGFDEAVSYCITSSLPSNYNAYRSYRFVIHDSNEPGIVPDMSSIKVTVASADETVKKDITDNVLILSDENGLHAECRDLKAVYAYAAGDEKILMTYDAFLDIEKATAGADTNDNYCYLEYRSSPVSDRMRETEKVKARIYTWIMELIKTDAGTGSALDGAKYVICDEAGNYLNKNGTLSEKETEDSIWVTDIKGRITVKCIDSGTYTITEVEAPEGYIKEQPFTLSIEAEPQDRGPVLKASVKGINAGIGSVDAKTGKVSVNIREERIPLVTGGIPATGDSSNMFLYACMFAGAAAVIMISALIIRRMSRRTGRNM